MDDPPYAQPLIKYFAEKLCAEFVKGNVDEAISLVNNATDSTWFQAIASQSSAICFTNKRIRFLDVNGNPGSPLQGQAIIYFGHDVKSFVDNFLIFGFCMRHV